MARQLDKFEMIVQANEYELVHKDKRLDRSHYYYYYYYHYYFIIIIIIILLLSLVLIVVVILYLSL